MELTDEQLWNQKVLDVFLKLDKLGFNTNLDWFYALKKDQHIKFYIELYSIKKVQKNINAKMDVLKIAPDQLIVKNHDIRWWQEETLRLIDSFITSGKDYSYRASGALYVVRCLCLVSYAYADAYDWILG